MFTKDVSPDAYESNSDWQISARKKLEKITGRYTHSDSEPTFAQLKAGECIWVKTNQDKFWKLAEVHRPSSLNFPVLFLFTGFDFEKCTYIQEEVQLQNVFDWCPESKEFTTRVYHREVFRLHLCFKNGRIGRLPPPGNILPRREGYGCRPCTYRLYVEPVLKERTVCRIRNCSDYDNFSLCSCWKAAAALENRLANGKQTNHHLDPSDPKLIRCHVRYACQNLKCSNMFRLNSQELLPVGTNFLDPNTLEEPQTTCHDCGDICTPTLAEPFDCGIYLSYRENPPAHCTTCIANVNKSEHCKNHHNFKRQPSSFDTHLFSLASEIGGGEKYDWSVDVNGLCIENLVVEGKVYRLLISPSIFVVPILSERLAKIAMKRHALSVESECLLHNTAPMTLRTHKSVLVAVNHLTCDKNLVLNDKEMRRKNHMCDLFLENANYSDPVLCDGFLRFPLKLPSSENFETENWVTAYHGTNIKSAGMIFYDGQLKKPGEEGVTRLHGQCGSTSGASIYTSPSKEKAAFPTYSQLFKLNLTSQDEDNPSAQKFGQLVFEVKVRPGSYKIQPSSLGRRNNHYWPKDLCIDPRFSTNEALEWLIEKKEDLVLSAILVREFGSGSELFGSLNTLVDPSFEHPLLREKVGPEYSWTDLRKNDFIEKGYFCEEVTGLDCCVYIRAAGESRVLGSIIKKKAVFVTHTSSFDKNSCPESLAQVFQLRYPVAHAQLVAKHKFESKCIPAECASLRTEATRIQEKESAAHPLFTQGQTMGTQNLNQFTRTLPDKQEKVNNLTKAENQMVGQTHTQKPGGVCSAVKNKTSRESSSIDKANSNPEMFARAHSQESGSAALQVTLEGKFLCVESTLARKVLSEGFRARLRKNIAVEITEVAAIIGYQKHHHEPYTVFQVECCSQIHHHGHNAVLRGMGCSQIHTFCNERGSWRISGNSIPATYLRLVKTQIPKEVALPVSLKMK